MPKRRKGDTRRVDVDVALADYRKLRAVGYLEGFADKYTRATRKIFALGLETYIAGLDEKQRSELDFILKQLDIQDDLTHS